MGAKKRTIKELTPWAGLPNDFNPEDWEGYVYTIVHVPSSKCYIGRKYFWKKLRKKVRGKKRKKLVVTESDWRFYKSSSVELKKDIEEIGLDSFRFEILSLHKTRAQTNYEEVKLMFQRDVLHSLLPSGEYEFYNYNILGRYYRGKI